MHPEHLCRLKDSKSSLKSAVLGQPRKKTTVPFFFIRFCYASVFKAEFALNWAQKKVGHLFLLGLFFRQYYIDSNIAVENNY